jgi:hypothetical protein
MKSIVVCLSLFIALGFSACGQETTMPSTGTINGELVLEDGTPAVGFEVLVEHQGLSGITDHNSRFVINGVMAVDHMGMGKYYELRARGEIQGVDFGCLVEHFKVKGAQSYSIGRVVVKPTGSISGVIQLPGSTDHSGTRVGIEGTTLECYTHADGSFLLMGVPEHSGYVLPCTQDGYQEMRMEHHFRSEDPIVVISGQETVLASMGMSHRN